METYHVNYDGQPLATLVITDRAKAGPVLREMVEFWSSGEENLERAGGDYTKAFCRTLADHVLSCGRRPGKEDEGWVPLDGSYGILVKDVRAYEFDPDMIEIEEA